MPTGERPWREYRLRSSVAIAACFREGRRVRRRTLLLAFRFGSGCEYPRFAVAVPKKLGTAVARNRVKRWLREAFRALSVQCHPGWDIVAVAQAHPDSASFALYRRELQSALEQAHLLVR